MDPDELDTPLAGGSAHTKSQTLDEPRYAFLAEHCPALLWIASPDARYEYVNDTWLRFTGRSLQEELGQGWTQCVHPEDLALSLETYERRVREVVPFEIEFRLRRHDGVYRWMLDRGVPIRTEGRFQGFVGCCVDIHERHESPLVRQSFLRMMAHELRTPLQAVRMFMEILRRDADGGRVSTPETFERMEIQFERFHRLINDLSRTDRSGDSCLNLTRMDLADLLRTIAGQRRAALRESPGRIRHDLDFRGPDRAEIRGDRERLEEAFHHVIDNAIKFSPRGGAVEITLESDDEMHRVAVRDQGVGIPAEDLAQVSQRFFRGSNVPRRNYPGLGLGLALAREVVEQHGGGLSVDSAVGRGTEVTLALPRMGDGA